MTAFREGRDRDMEGFFVQIHLHVQSSVEKKEQHGRRAVAEKFADRRIMTANIRK